MMTLVTANFVPIAASLLIGIATARWAFRRPAPGPDRT